jgi:hypothetical protein
MKDESIEFSGALPRVVHFPAVYVNEICSITIHSPRYLLMEHHPNPMQPSQLSKSFHRNFFGIHIMFTATTIRVQIRQWLCLLP